ncbi:MAG: GNAT family N-acetyltransferase [Porticoccaceae bacterium]|nr:GNAT family N-acetyltransferase [Porticoccaceae bacterium]
MKNNKTEGNNGVTFEFVWENIGPELIEKVISFWVSENAFQGDRAIMESRARQLIVVARDADKNIIAVNTAERMKIPLLLNNWFYFYRVFVSPAYRKKGVMMAVSHRAREYLHQRFISGEDTVAKGFYTAAENSILQKVQTQAVMVIGGIDHPFIGVDKKGRHLRVGWFDGATID